ncbi:CU044_5270 family protein, partial [Actinomadura kijaniata]|uniref:CU044_5270 family protein n=1 Tax=Actinomadura kijaniata TaxID=46161 RepID=UPI00082E0046
WLRVAAVGGAGLAVAAGAAVVPGLTGGEVANARELLDRAATAAQERSFTAPKPHQWSYVETRYERIRKPGKGEVATVSTPRETTVDRIWTRVDGTRMALYEKGKLLESATGGGSPPTDYATLSRLPRDPDALLAHVRGTWELMTRDNAEVFAMLGSTLNNSVLPPAQEATIYRAMAKLPGVKLTKGGKDIAGRPVIAVSMVQEGWIREDVLLDPKTYVYRGHRSVAVADHRDRQPEGGWTIRKGTVESQSARQVAGFVDRPGQRP